MPNLKKHATVGAAVGGGVNLIWQLVKLYDSPKPPKDFWEALGRVEWGTVAVFAVGGAMCAALPDILEPANNPNHRALFHGVCCGGAVTYGAFGKHSEKWSIEDRLTARVAALSYLSHLALDAGTPKGIPLIC